MSDNNGVAKMAELRAKRAADMGVTKAMCDLEWKWYGAGTEVGLEREDCDGIAVAGFLRDVGHMPRCAEEMDAYSNSEEEHAAYQAAHPVESKPTTFDFAAIGAAYPWFADLAEDVQNAAREQWQEAAADDATLMPTDGMDNQEQWEKVLESWMRDRATKAAEEITVAADAEYKMCLDRLRGMAKSEGELRMTSCILFYTAVRARLAGNVSRETKVRRAAAIAELRDLLLESVASTDGLSVNEISARVRDGSTMSILFGATVKEPIIGADGICRKSSPRGIEPYSTYKIGILSPLVVKTASDTEERHATIDGAVTLKGEAISEKLSRDTLREAVTKLCAAHYRSIADSQPNNKAIASEAAKWEAKLPEADASEEVDVKQPQGDAGTVDVAPTPNAPQSLINPPMPPAEDTGDINMDAELGKTIGSMLMDDCEDPIAVLRSQFRAMLDDGGMDEAQTLCIKGMLTLAARHAAGQQTTVEESK